LQNLLAQLKRSFHDRVADVDRRRAACRSGKRGGASDSDPIPIERQGMTKLAKGAPDQIREFPWSTALLM
jgi:hypothetical protein